MDYTKQAILSGVGRRKRSYAKVYLVNGTGKIIINRKPIDNFFFQNQFLINMINEPIQLIDSSEKFDIIGFVHGGGCNGQASALRLAISKSLAKLDIETRKLLKKQKLLQTDSRVVERKKYGLKKARKASQYSKR